MSAQNFASLCPVQYMQRKTVKVWTSAYILHVKIQEVPDGTVK